MIPAELIAREQQLLNQARVISEVPAAGTTHLGHSRPGSGSPSGAFTYTVSTLGAFGARFTAANATGSEVNVQSAIVWAQGELDAITHGPPGRFAETGEQFAFRVLEQYEGLSAPEVVRREQGTTSVTTVRNLRIAAGRDAARGHTLPPVKQQ